MRYFAGILAVRAVSRCSGSAFLSQQRCKSYYYHDRKPLSPASSQLRPKSTINIDRSIELGLMVPNVDLAEIGISSHIGKRERQEDRCVVEQLSDDILFLGIFDGHGGSLAVDFTSQHFPSLFKSFVSNGKRNNMEEVMSQAFCQLNNKLLQYIRKNRPQRERYSGTTAVVCLLIDNIHLHTASVGDSRAILCRQSKALSLTQDHNPDREDERKRVESEGGSIISNSLGEPQVNGRLAMTRSIGDFDLKDSGVTAVPEYNYTKINHTRDAFLALVTDGITFPMSNQEIVTEISTCETPQEAADHVTECALHLQSHDNSSAIVVPLGTWGQDRPEETGGSSFGFGRILTLRD